MEHIQGFTQNHWMLPMGECLRSIAPEVATVIEIGGKHIHIVHTPWVTPLALAFSAVHCHCGGEHCVHQHSTQLSIVTDLMSALVTVTISTKDYGRVKVRLKYF
jgi:hypothetical protein